MKKISCCFLSLLLLLSPFVSVTALAKTSNENCHEQISVYNPCSGTVEYVNAEEVIVFPDGSKMITTIIQTQAGAKTRGSISGSRERLFLNDNNVLQFKVILTATFSFNGTSSTCTQVSSSTVVYSGNWSESSNSTYPSGNAAIANITVVRRFLFIVTETQNLVLTLHCDRYGNLY